MELLNVLNVLYREFIGFEGRHPTYLLIHPEDHESITKFVEEAVIGFDPRNGNVTFRGIRAVRSFDMPISKPEFV